MPSNGFFNASPYLFYPCGIKHPKYKVGDVLYVRKKKFWVLHMMAKHTFTLLTDAQIGSNTNYLIIMMRKIGVRQSICRKKQREYF